MYTYRIIRHRLFLPFGALVALSISVPSAASLAQSVPLQNATATFTQPHESLPDLWIPAHTIDGVIEGFHTSWAINHELPNTPETIVWETVNDLTASQLKFDLYHRDIIPIPGHNLGHFRLSYTTDDRSLFADGLANGGDVSANWTVIVPTSVSSTEGDSFTVLADNSILVGGTLGGYPTYTVLSDVNATGITGFRLEALLDASLPFNGPGRQPVNGNFHLSEFVVMVVPEPENSALVSGLALLGLFAIHRRATRK